jgi:hypothetical protein
MNAKKQAQRARRRRADWPVRVAALRLQQEVHLMLRQLGDDKPLTANMTIRQIASRIFEASHQAHIQLTKQNAG